ncbi:MAG: sterol desaturase family protein [Bacteroidia bacterium]
MSPEFVDPQAWALPVFVALVLGEFAYSTAHNDEVYSWKDLSTSSLLGLGSVLITAIFHFISAVVLVFWVYDVCNPLTDGVRMNWMGYASFGWAWYVWLLCQIGDDLSYYWRHRFNHTVRFMWASHLAHHSSTKYNMGIALRNGWFTVLWKPLYYLWLPAIGFPPEMVIICMAIESLWLFQLHANYVPKLGFFETFINTHKQHQVHHACNVEYLDKNHGGLLNIFDRIFGTWRPFDDNIEIEYGMVHPPKSDRALAIVGHEYARIWKDVKSAKSLYEAFMYIFGEPGWSPDGSTLTVKQIQRKLRETH